MLIGFITAKISYLFLIPFDYMESLGLQLKCVHNLLMEDIIDLCPLKATIKSTLSWKERIRDMLFDFKPYIFFLF